MISLKKLFSKNRFSILMYHHVGPVTDKGQQIYFVSPEMFEKQLDLLLTKGFHPLRLEELEEALLTGKPLPPKSVLLTMDDGWRDNYEYAFPIAARKNVPFTIFLSTSLTGNDPQLLGWEQVREMYESGLVSFSSHGANHKRLRSLTDEEALAELTESKKNLETFLGKPVISFCYPFGAFDRRVRKLTFQAGYKIDIGTRKGMNHLRWNRRRPLKRAHPYFGENLDDFLREITKGRK